MPDADKVNVKALSMSDGTNTLQIRNKRLAKLGGSASAPTRSSSPSESQGEYAAASSQPEVLAASEGTEAPDKEPEEPETRVSSSPSITAASPNPFSQLGIKQSNGEAPKINIMTSSARPSSLKRDRPSSSGERPTTQVETLEQWEDKTLSEIFRVTLDPKNHKNMHGHRLRFLQSTKQDIEESGEEARLSTGTLDQALLEAASNLGKNTTPLDYLLGCWKRITREWKPLRKAREQDPKFIVVKEARRLCMSYCIFAITMPDMFG